MVPRAVLMKFGLVSLNTARQVNTAHPKIIVNSARLETDIREKDEKSSKNRQNQARNGKAWKSQSQIKAKVQERQSQRSKPEPTPKNT
ncbi:hypothetical protein Tco_0358359 [Tanacetum coccineum]